MSFVGSYNGKYMSLGLPVYRGFGNCTWHLGAEHEIKAWLWKKCAEDFAKARCASVVSM